MPIEESQSTDLFEHSIKDTTDKERWHRRHPKVAIGLWVSLGVFLLFVATQSFWSHHLIRHAIRSNIRKQFIFSETDDGNKHYDDWKNGGGVPIYFEVRFFNVTNSREVLTEGVYPQLEIVGPLVYMDHQTKINVSFDETGEWASYRFWEHYTYCEEKSVVKRDDYVVIISPWTGFLWSMYNGTNSKVEKDGIEDIVYALNKEDPHHVLYINGTANDAVFAFINKTFTGNNPNNSISVVTGALTNYTTEDAPWETTNTGYLDNSKLGAVKSWEKSEYINCDWEPTQALEGGFDTYYGLFHTVSKSKNINAWVYSNFRNTLMQYNHTKIWKGIELWTYYVERSQYSDVTIDASMVMWDQFGYNGLANITRCENDLPTFVSLPLFIGCLSCIYTLPLFGLRMPTVKDNTFVDIEPTTGAIMRANKSLQINWVMHSLPINYTHPHVTDCSSILIPDWWCTEHRNESLAIIPDALVPAYIFTQRAEISNSDVKSFKTLLTAKWMRHAVIIIGYIGWVLFVVWICVSLYGWGLKKQNRKSTIVIN